VKIPIFLAAAAGLSLAGATNSVQPNPEIRIDDVSRFYALYDATGGKPTAQQIQQQYLAQASAGLVEFARLRNITSERIAAALAQRPEIYSNARRCAALMPRVKSRLALALAKLGRMYPKAKFPPVTIAVGRGKPVGVGNGSGVMIGLEALCAADIYQSDLEGSFVHVIAHEYAHVMQPAAQVEDPKDSVLKASLIEGGAELVAELVSGSVANPNLAVATKGREQGIETAFLADIDKTAIGSKWLYNSPGTKAWPSDLGYWVGYRITKAYYREAKDKKAALREIIEINDAKAFLAKSGWHPGIRLN
jgi:hypothetical protein